MSLLFRYRKLDAYTISGLLRNELWLSSGAAFNDPFEFCFKPDYDMPPSEFLRRVDESIPEAVLNDASLAKKAVNVFVRGIVDGYRDRVGVCCFSGLHGVDLDEQQQISMWSHYADDHKGICCVFDLDEESCNLCSDVRPVTYSRRMPQIPVTSFITGDQDVRIERIFQMLTTKSEIWTNEKEQRLLLPNRVNEAIQYGPRTLKAIIIGAKAPADVKATINSIFENREHKPKTVQAELHEETFRIVIPNLN